MLLPSIRRHLPLNMKTTYGTDVPLQFPCSNAHCAPELTASSVAVVTGHSSGPGLDPDRHDGDFYILVPERSLRYNPM